MTPIESVRLAVKSVLHGNVLPQQKIVVAFSGGMDSRVLLETLSGHRDHFGFSLTAIHFHHGLSMSADAWAEGCAGVCKALGVPLDIQYLEIPDDSGEGIEAAARRLRRRVFEQLDADWIALGHHADDQAETLLLNLFRGAGILGMSGMRAVEGCYLRPLLNLNRGQLAAYAANRGLSWCEDESNLSSRFTRNYIRHEVIPFVSQKYPALSRKISTSAEHFATAQRLLVDLAKIDAGEAPLEFPFPLASFRLIDSDRGANLLRCLITNSNMQNPPTERMYEFVRQLIAAAPDRHPELRVGKHVLKVRNKRLHLESIK